MKRTCNCGQLVERKYGNDRKHQKHCGQGWADEVASDRCPGCDERLDTVTLSVKYVGWCSPCSDD